MREFLFLRHGETDWNVDRRMQGQISDVPLNDNGKRQAARAAALLAGQSIDLIISSTLERAKMTAQIVAAGRSIPIVYDPRLIERGWGDAEGKYFDQIQPDFPEAFDVQDGKVTLVNPEKCQPQRAETYDEVEERAVAALFDYFLRYPDRLLLFVSHADTLQGLVHRLTGSAPGFSNAVPYRASENAEGWIIKALV
jgi:broad specificity phosphatase PhoE